MADEPTVRYWEADQLLQTHQLPLGQVLELLAAADEQQAVERLLDLLCTVINAGSAHAIEYVQYGDTLKVRQVIVAAHEGSSPSASEIVANTPDFDPAHEQVVALANHTDQEGMYSVQCHVLPAATDPEARRRGMTGCERVSVVYTVAQNTAWVLHLFPSWPKTEFDVNNLSELLTCAFLLREVHRIVCPASSGTGERVNKAEVRLGVRAPVLSGRERQICARIAVGHSTDIIATELGISASTVTTLRKRAYEKLGIHGRLDLHQLAA